MNAAQNGVGVSALANDTVVLLTEPDPATVKESLARSSVFSLSCRTFLSQVERWQLQRSR